MSKEELKIEQGIIRTSTNSQLGSYHWFHTILARHKHIGEFLKDRTPDEETLRAWGKKLYETSQELIDGYDHINCEEGSTLLD